MNTSLMEWLEKEITRAKETLADLDVGTVRFEQRAGKEWKDTTAEDRGEVEDRLKRNSDLLQQILDENKNEPS